MRLHDLSPADGARKNRKRKGRGVGSGLGKTAGRGTKGHNARSGGGTRPGFEGGQMPLHRRLPKRGFKNIFKTPVEVVNVRDLNRFESGSVVDQNLLTEAGLISRKAKQVKVLGQGNLNVALTLHVGSASKSAREKIEAAGGKVEVN
ncbi:MAG: 50S ribosomal protein L15 [Desulfobacterales bacterium]|nr:50S ribosomal protein L15 [Desulfobacterales bacterium]